MPIYEYKCSQCAKIHEIFQGINDPAITECPDCHTASMERQISLSGFRLKGSGWYVTDRQSNQSQNSNSASKPTEKTEAGNDHKSAPEKTDGDQAKSKTTAPEKAAKTESKD